MKEQHKQRIIDKVLQDNDYLKRHPEHKEVARQFFQAGFNYRRAYDVNERMKNRSFKKDARFEQFLDDIDPFINRTGEVTTAELWNFLREDENLGYGYGYVAKNFQIVMTFMVEQGKAERVKNGTWKILKPNRPIMRPKEFITPKMQAL